MTKKRRWRSRQLGTRAAILLGLTLAAATARAEDDADLVARAERIHREAIVVDGHNDVTTFILDFGFGFDLGMNGAGPDKKDGTLYWVPGIRALLPRPDPKTLRTDTDLRRLRAGGVDAQFFSIFVDEPYVPDDASEAGRARQRALDMITAVMEQVRRHPQELELAIRADDVRCIAAESRIAVLMGIEGGHAIEDSLEILREFADLGVRYMTLTWNNANAWADSCYEQPNGGLTDFGREVVHEMNRLGIVVDVSHVSDQILADAIEASRAPVIASHSSARALVPFARNLGDEMLRSVRRNHGVVMVNFQDVFIDAEKVPVWGALSYAIRHLGWPRTPYTHVVDHIEHVISVAGIDHVGLGSDFAGSFNMPEGLSDVSDFPNLTRELLRRGHSEEDVHKILGGSTLRVMAEAERVSAVLRGSPPGD